VKYLSFNHLLLQIDSPVTVTSAGGPLSGLSVLEQFLVVLIVLVFMLGCWSLLNLSKTLMQMQQLRILEKFSPEVIKEVGIEVLAPEIPWWKQLYDKLNDRAPMEEEESILLDHNYDGVMELDNNLPPWWKGVFYIAIAFAPIYLYFNHFSDYGSSSAEAYDQEIVYAQEQVKAYLATQKNAVDESNVTVLVEADAISNGKTIFDAKRSVCHGKLGEGGIGPNLTDPYWIHGGSIADLFRTIKNGVPEKGMISWKSELRPRDMQEVASYIKSLDGSNPPNAKEPQGDIYNETSSSK
jgi:cytochrome c oxidase cbb3-type subunit 3